MWRDRIAGAASPKALLATVFGVLAERGIEWVTTEADVTNAASHALLTSIGGRGVGGYVELARGELARGGR